MKNEKKRKICVYVCVHEFDITLNMAYVCAEYGVLKLHDGMS